MVSKVSADGNWRHFIIIKTLYLLQSESPSMLDKVDGDRGEFL